MQVEVRVVGQRGSRLAPRALPLPPDPSPTLRDLIAHVVRTEVDAFADREQRRRFVRVLTPDEITAGTEAGKVDSGGRPPTGPVDPELAVETAIEAFGDGLYLAFVDDLQVERLEDAVVVGADTRIRFVRLTPLAGG